MSKIVSSRSAVSDPNIERLQEILKTASLGGLGHPGDPDTVVNLETNMTGLVDQTSTLFSGMLTTLEEATDELCETALQLFQLQSSFDLVSEGYNKLTQSVGYDEALDHAAIDLMDCFAAAGALDVTADGELMFDERISFTKADIKPMLQAAITRWVSIKRLG